MNARKNGEKFEEPEILKFIFNLENEYILSNITKTEISRYMSAEWNADEKMCNEAWNEFIETYNIAYLIVKEMDFDELTNICLVVKTKKKTLVNLIHMQVAKRESIWFLTGEDNLIKKYKEYHDRTLSYEDFRKMTSS